MHRRKAACDLPFFRSSTTSRSMTLYAQLATLIAFYYTPLKIFWQAFESKIFTYPKNFCSYFSYGFNLYQNVYYFYSAFTYYAADGQTPNRRNATV